MESNFDHYLTIHNIIMRKEGPAPSCSGIVVFSLSTLCLRRLVSSIFRWDREGI